MARITLYMRNKDQIDFESAVFKPTIKDGKLVGAEFFKKDRGVSLLFADWSEVVAVTRDSRLEDKE